MTGSKPRFLHLDETGSTNKDAMRLALAGEALPLWVSAGRQTEGRGRSGRTWASGAGNVQASVAFVCGAPLTLAGQLSLVAGISAIDAVRTTSGLASDVRLRLKWPNDVLIGTAKAGGILVESMMARGEPGFLAVIGFGINVATCPDDLGRAATSLANHGGRASAEALLAGLADQTARWLGIWNQGEGFPAIRAAWMERAGPVSEAIEVNTATGRFSGTYQGLSASGGLLAETDGKHLEISYGDVALCGSEAGGG